MPSSIDQTTVAVSSAAHHSRAPLLSAPTTNPFIPSLSQAVAASNPEYWSKRYNSIDSSHSHSGSGAATTSAKEYLQKHTSSNGVGRGGGDTDDEDGGDLDAAKRKSLPAWIREGLEKMEREKQKQEERDREWKEREVLMQQRRLAEEEAMKEIAQETMIPKKSKFVRVLFSIILNLIQIGVDFCELQNVFFVRILIRMTKNTLG